MVECVLDKQRTDVEVGGAVVEVVDEIDWNFGQMYVSKKKNFVMRLGIFLAYVSPGGVVLLASAKIDIETDRKIVEEEVRNDKEEQVS